MNITQDNLTFSVPLTRLAHQYAQESSAQKAVHPKFKESYLNHLAIYAVNYYLKCFSIEANIKKTSLAIKKVLSEQSYLEIEGKGKIECRSVLPHEKFCYIPIESWSDRIGYVAVKLNSELTEATLLGFLPIVNTEQVFLEQFQALDELLDYLRNDENKVLLLSWFTQVFTAGWQSLDKFLIETGNPSENLAYQFRHQSFESQQQSIKGVKVLTFNLSDNINSELSNHQVSKLQDISIKFKSQSVILLLAIAPEVDNKIDIQIRLYPSQEEKYLPTNIHLELLSEQGQALRSVISHQYDNWIQLPLIKCSPNETFNVRVSLDNMSITEVFTV